MTTQSGNSADDAFWRRPTGPPADAPESTPGSPPPPPPVRPEAHYPGPPPTITPPAGWRPPLHVQPAAPRALPGQDHAALDAEEGSARTLTYGVGLVGGAVVLVLMCLLCSRALF